MEGYRDEKDRQNRRKKPSGLCCFLSPVICSARIKQARMAADNKRHKNRLSKNTAPIYSPMPIDSESIFRVQFTASELKRQNTHLLIS